MSTSDTQDTTSGDGGQDTTGGEGSPDRSAELQQQLQQANAQAAQAKVYAQMMQDPDFAALARAKASGKAIKISVGEETKSIVDTIVPKPDPDDQIDLKTIDNEGLVQYMLRKTAGVVEKVIDTKLQPVMQNLQSVQQQTAEQVKEKRVGELNQVRQKFPDFDKHVDRIVALSDQMPNATPMQLYAMAKAEAGEPIVSQRHTSSERPSSVAGRPSSQQTRKTQVPGGLMGMRQLIKEAASRLPSSGVLDQHSGEDLSE